MVPVGEEDDMFYTVQQLLAQNQGWAYLIAVLFLVLLVPFLRMLLRGR